jgi:FixJ family two-component response regulator
MNSTHAHAVRGAAESTEAPVVFIVDCDATVRTALELLVRSNGWQPMPLACAEDFLDRQPANAASCLVVEQHLPGLDGLELQRRVAGRAEMPTIFLSSCADVQSSVQAMKAGAVEYLAKPFIADVLLHAIRHAIARSEAALRHAASTRLLQQRQETLSRREREVMNLVVAGRMNKQAAGELGISEITVKAHRGKLMRKMQARSLPELVRMAMSLRDGIA